MILVEVFRIYPVVRVLTCLAAVLDRSKLLFDIAATRNDKSSVSVHGAFRNDIHDAVNGVCSPDRSPGSADHLDSLNVFQWEIHGVPVDAARGLRVHGASID